VASRSSRLGVELVVVRGAGVVPSGDAPWRCYFGGRRQASRGRSPHGVRCAGTPPHQTNAGRSVGAPYLHTGRINLESPVDRHP
jgi:hypothetical protein